MADADTFARHYLFVDVHRAATGDAVAELFERAASALRQHGAVNVQHVAFDVADQSSTATTSLTVYYDRVERRRHPRAAESYPHPSHAEPNALRPVD